VQLCSKQLSLAGCVDRARSASNLLKDDPLAIMKLLIFLTQGVDSGVETRLSRLKFHLRVIIRPTTGEPSSSG
jgi:hypothetical protein